MLREQRRANSRLSALLYLAVGVLLGLVAMQAWVWVRIHFF